jgi:hypothetical protein
MQSCSIRDLGSTGSNLSAGCRRRARQDKRPRGLHAQEWLWQGRAAVHADLRQLGLERRVVCVLSVTATVTGGDQHEDVAGCASDSSCSVDDRRTNDFAAGAALLCLEQCCRSGQLQAAAPEAMRAAILLCAGVLTGVQAWPGSASTTLDAKSCLDVQQGINEATGAAANGEWEQAVELEGKALRLLEISGTPDDEPRQWKECDTAEGYDKSKHGYLHFRLAVALQEQGRPDDALRNFDHARVFDKDLEVDAMLNMGLLCLHLNRLIEAEIQLTNVVRAISKLSEISTERRDREGEHEGVLRAMSALGDVYARQMRVDQAKSTYKKVLAAAPHDTETLLKLGSLEQWLGGLRHEPMQWVDALTAHASALRSPKLKAASEEDHPKSEEAEEKQGASLAAAYRSAPEIHLRMAGLLELVANHGTTGRGLVEAAEHVASALEMSDTGTAIGWRALFTQLRLDTRLCAWQQLRPQTAVTADFLQTALHARPPTEEETAAAIAAAEEAAAKAEAEEAEAAKEMAKLTSRQRKKQRKEAAKQKKKNAQTLEQLLAAQELLAAGLSAGNIPTIPLSPFELWELPYSSELGTLAAAAARAQGFESTAQQQLVAAQARLNSTGCKAGDDPLSSSSSSIARFTEGVAVPESRRAQVAVLFPSWWNDSFLVAFLAMMRALADTKRLEMVVYNLAGDATAAADAIKQLCEDTWEPTDGAIRMVEGGYLVRKHATNAPQACRFAQPKLLYRGAVQACVPYGREVTRGLNNHPRFE